MEIQNKSKLSNENSDIIADGTGRNQKLKNKIK